MIFHSSFLQVFFIACIFSSPFYTANAHQERVSLQVEKQNHPNGSDHSHVLDPNYHFCPKDAQGLELKTGISMFGKPNQDGAHAFSLVNTQAPKGGELKIAYSGGAFNSFNLLNPMTDAAPLTFFLYDPLMKRCFDQPFTLYGLIAQYIQVPEDPISFMIIHVNPKARFQDGSPVLAKDIEWSFTHLAAHGTPTRKALAAKVKAITILSSHSLRFDFLPQKDGVYDREAPLVICLIPIMSHKSVPAGKTFADMGLQPFISSGPYRLGSQHAGRFVVYERDENYWAKDLPILRGIYNFDKISIEVFADKEGVFQAFTKGDSYFFQEKDSEKWQRAYTFPGVKEGRVKRIAWHHKQGVGMNGLAFNQDNPSLDFLTRQALTIVVDPAVFTTAHTKPTESFFQDTLFHAQENMTPEEEVVAKALPAPFSPHLASHLRIPSQQRKSKALALLAKAGWRTERGKLVKNGKSLVLTLILPDRVQVKFAELVARAWKSIGVEMVIRMLDGAAYNQALRDGQYDLAGYVWMHSFCPGIEQSLYYHSASCSKPGSRNYGKIKDANVDYLCEQLVRSTTYEQLTARVRVLDRVLRAGFYILPLFHDTHQYFAYWADKIDTPPYSDGAISAPLLESFWATPQNIQNSAGGNKKGGALPK